MIFPIILDCCLSHWLVGHPKARTYYGNSLLAPFLECLKEFRLLTWGLKSGSCQGPTVHVAGKCYPCHSWGHLLWPQKTGDRPWGTPFPKTGGRLVILHVSFTGEHKSLLKASRKGGIINWMRDESYDLYEELRCLRSLHTSEITSRSELGSCILTFIEVPVATSNQKEALGLSPVAHSERVVYHRLESDLSL